MVSEFTEETANPCIRGVSAGVWRVEKEGAEEQASLHEDGKETESTEVGRAQMASTSCR